MKFKLPCGKDVLVSDCDWPVVCQMSWYDRSGGYPAARWKKSLGGDGKIVMLRRFIMQPPPGLVVDHIDGNTLNCTRENLQVTTHSRNLMRSPSKRNGVEARHGKFYARTRIDGQIVRLGVFPSRQEAQDAVDAARDAAWHGPANILGTVR